MNFRTFLVASLLLHFLLVFSSAALSQDAKNMSVTSEMADKKTYLADITTLLKKKWPDNRTINIVCHGHSVPSGYFKTPLVDTFNAYPHLLHKGLKESYPYAVINVFVTGIGGESSDTGAERFGRDVLTLKPDVITIDYALNDRRLGLESARKAWIAMIKKAQEKGIKVILLTPTPDQRNDIKDPNDQLSQHANQVRELAREYHVALVDSYSLFLRYVQNGGVLKDLMSQVNHPNRKGHDLVTKALLEWFPE